MTEGGGIFGVSSPICTCVERLLRKQFWLRLSFSSSLCSAGRRPLHLTVNPLGDGRRVLEARQDDCPCVVWMRLSHGYDLTWW